MCGIAGIFHGDSQYLGSELRVILEHIQHRGYSPFELEEGHGWALGANRLEIVDKENGRQPFFSEDRKVSVVFNGEIYNYIKLKEELIREGCSFISNTDTEVLAHGYAHWGLSLFERLDGVFSILIHDAEKSAFVAARDPVGVKPLYYIQHEKKVSFASEIKALLHLGDDMQEVKPGYYMNGLSEVKRYDYRHSIKVSSGLRANADTFRDLFSNAVRKRVQTDLPIAIFLSGGIDSGAVLYEALNHHPDVTAFSIGKHDAEDVIAARSLCDVLKVKFVHIPATDEELLAIIPDVVRTIESFEPNHTRGGTLSYLLSKEVAKQGYRVALCGEGADELFGGYYEFALALLDKMPHDKFKGLFDRFLGELYKTQLQRVDRTSMRHTLEVRVPYLDKRILDFSHALPLDQKIKAIQQREIADKRVLREAYRNILPDWLVDREKAVLSLGAGFGSNGPEGVFFENGLNMVTENQLQEMQKRFPDFKLSTSEEAYYFSLFIKTFGEIDLVKSRPMVNSTRENT